LGGVLQRESAIMSADRWDKLVDVLQSGKSPTSKLLGRQFRIIAEDIDYGNTVTLPSVIAHHIADIFEGKVDRRGRPKVAPKPGTLRDQADGQFIEEVNTLRDELKQKGRKAFAKEAFNTIAARHEWKDAEVAKRNYRASVARFKRVRPQGGGF
jgi:hypothetical protein